MRNNGAGFTAKNGLPLVRFAARNMQAIQMSSPTALMRDYRLGFSAKNGLPPLRFAAQNVQEIKGVSLKFSPRRRLAKIYPIF